METRKKIKDKSDVAAVVERKVSAQSSEIPSSGDVRLQMLDEPPASLPGKKIHRRRNLPPVPK